MLPDIDAKEWHVLGALISNLVLISRLQVSELLSILIPGEPAPAATLQDGGACVEVRLESLNGAPLFLNKRAQLGALIWDVSTAVRDRRQRLPEKLVVQVAATIELDILEQAGVRSDAAIGLLQGLIALFLESVEVVDISSMMLAIVEVHDGAANDRLERAQLIREWLQFDALGSASHLGCVRKSALGDQLARDRIC